MFNVRDSDSVSISLSEFQSLHFFQQFTSHLGWTPGHNHTGLLQRVDLVLSAALASGYDGTCEKRCQNRSLHSFRSDVPAWPMRRPGGAVSPAMNETTGLARMPWKRSGGGL